MLEPTSVSIPPEISWVSALQPIVSPRLERLTRFTDVEAWHVDLALTPVIIEEGRSLRGSDNWNGKALVVPQHHALKESVGEVEIAQRLRCARWEAYWSKGQKKWHDWTLRSAPLVQHTWFAEVDARIRQHDPRLTGNTRGMPDVVAWRPREALLYCIEYKGPSPSNPQRMDEIKEEQVGWYSSAIATGVLVRGRYVVARWVPSAEAALTLRRQAVAQIK